MKVLEAVRWGEALLKIAGLDDPRVDADLLLASVLNCTRDKLYLEREAVLNMVQETMFRQLIERRQKREPVQYILKRQEFMGLEFYVDERVLIPRPDSEILVEKLLELHKQEDVTARVKKTRILDVCTGSGALAIAIAYYWPESEVVGMDLSGDALSVAELNARSLGVQVEWRQGDLLEPAQGETWDWILSNPPYVTEEEYRNCAPEIFAEPEAAFLGGRDGLDYYRRLAKEASPLLASDGGLLLEIGWKQADAVKALFAGSDRSVTVFPDYAGRDRLILVR